MTGRRLLDATAIFAAARRVASKHVTLRNHQLEVYSKTSTLARVAQSQSDRVTLTAKAALALTKRLNGAGTQYTTQASQTDPPPEKAAEPKVDQNKKIGNNQQKEGFTQDHFYERSSKNTTADPTPKSDLYIKQEKNKPSSLPDDSTPAFRPEDSIVELDKTSPAENDTRSRSNLAEKAKKSQRQAEHQIPSKVTEPPHQDAQISDKMGGTGGDAADIRRTQEQEVFYEPSSSSGPVLSALPRTKILKNTEDTQEFDAPVPDEQINQDVFYSATPQDEQQAVPNAQAVPEQEQLPDEAYSEIFHSPKVAKMLKGQPRIDPPSKGLEPTGAKEIPAQNTKSPQDTDEVSSAVRTPLQDESATQGSRHDKESEDKKAQNNEDVHDLAAAMAKDADRASLDIPEVSPKNVATYKNAIIMLIR